MNEPKRRNGDFSWVNQHSVLIGIFGSVFGAATFVFLTFTTFKYVDKQDEQIYKYFDARLGPIDDNTREILAAIRVNEKKLDELKKEMRQ